MSGYDYNVGYLPSSEGQYAPIKKLIKWGVIALTLFLAVQYLQASSSEGNSKQSLVETKAEINRIEAVQSADQSITPYSKAISKHTGQNEKETVTVVTSAAVNNNIDLINVAQRSEDIMVASNDSETNTSEMFLGESKQSETNSIDKKSLDESFDKDLAKLLNQLLPE